MKQGTTLILVGFAVIVCVILLANINKEGFTAGYAAAYAPCINDCVDGCVKGYPYWARGPINSGSMLCERACEQACSKNT